MNKRPDEQQIDDFLQNTANSEEARIVLKWLATSEGQDYVSSCFDKDQSEANPEAEFLIDHPVPSLRMYRNIEAKIQKYERKQLRLNTFRKSWMKVAAVIVIPLLIAVGVMFWTEHSKTQKTIAWQEIYVPCGEKYQVVFLDGTRVLLNSDTRLKYPATFNGRFRQVFLSGEAYFYVHKNPDQPFLVHTRDLTVKVTGTSFNVKAYTDENRVTTTLDKGRISLLFPNIHYQEYVLKPGQQAVFAKAKRSLSIDSVKMGESSIWWNNVLVFNDTSLPQLLRTLERHYKVKFKIMNSEISKYTYTIRFDNESFDSVLAQLKEITPIQCIMKNGVIEVSKSKH